MPSLIAQILEEISSERIEFWMKKFPNVSNNDFAQAMRCDPSKSGAYLGWILKLLSNKTIRFPEDEDKVHERLKDFDSLKKKRGFEGHRDINKYKTFGDLAQAVRDNSGVKTKNEIKRELAIDGAELIGEKGDMKLYKVTTNEAGLALGWRQTEWCVQDPKFFKEYGPPFYCLMKDGKPFKLLHMGVDALAGPQCMDVNDNDTEFDEFSDLGLDLTPLFKKNIFWTIDRSIRLRKRFPEAEPFMLQWLERLVFMNEELQYRLCSVLVDYACALNMKWPALEKIIEENQRFACRRCREELGHYSKKFRGGHWPKVEEMLCLGDLIYYLMEVGRKATPEQEAEMAKSPSLAYEYAYHVLHRRWPEAEPTIMKAPYTAHLYAAQVMHERWPEAEAIIRNSSSWLGYRNTWGLPHD